MIWKPLVTLPSRAHAQLSSNAGISTANEQSKYYAISPTHPTIGINYTYPTNQIFQQKKFAKQAINVLFYIRSPESEFILRINW